jgi:hypothetical protein
MPPDMLLAGSAGIFGSISSEFSTINRQFGHRVKDNCMVKGMRNWRVNKLFKVLMRRKLKA